MAQLQTILNSLVLQYEGYFNIEQPHQFCGKEILFYARFSQRIEKYVLLRRAQLFATEMNEHVFIVHAPQLDLATWQIEKDRIIKAESDYVQAHTEHMYSYITLILLCDSIAEPVKNEIKRFRFTKNYRMSMHGYSTVRVGALDLSSGDVFRNPGGKEAKKVLDKAWHM